jgi:hypothetical protein
MLYAKKGNVKKLVDDLSIAELPIVTLHRVDLD